MQTRKIGEQYLKNYISMLNLQSLPGKTTNSGMQGHGRLTAASWGLQVLSGEYAETQTKEITFGEIFSIDITTYIN